MMAAGRIGTRPDPSWAVSRVLQPGARLGGRYRLDSRIGAGGMGEVWQAFDEVLNRVVALKAMLPAVADDPDFATRFLLEAQSMASVNHHAVAAIHDYGRSAGVTFLVMEFIEGSSLAQALRSRGRLGSAETMRLVAQAADGLQAVHDRGIVHRDIKPANLLIRHDGALIITDFGISRTPHGTGLTASGAILGTPTYLSPEQVLGQPATGLSDVYSLGLTAYECLAGHAPFEGDNPYAVALQRLRVAPRTLTGSVPVEVLVVIERALATDPAQRWPSAAAMAAAARAAMASGARPSGVRSAPVGPPSVGPSGGPSPIGSASRELSPAGPASSGHAPTGPVSGGHAPTAPVSGGHAPTGPVSGGHAPTGPVSGHATVGPAKNRSVSSRRRWAVLAAVLIGLLGSGMALWQVSRDGAAETPAGADPVRPANAPTDSALPDAALPDAALRQAGLETCGAALCPAVPLCWGGMTAINGKAYPPEKLDCTQNHVWETFAAIPLPAAAVGIRPEKLAGNKEIAAACSAKALRARSKDPAGTRDWIRDAWPIQLPGTATWLLHCIARPPKGDSSTSLF
jgi:serine/threonine protein kinase